MTGLAFFIEPLSPADIPDNVALAHAVGWQDSAGDWRVLHRAAVVLGVRDQGHLVAQGALGSYGEAGTIAKMVVAPDLQRRRIGGALLDGLLRESTRRSIRMLGLVATPSGRALYESRGFELVGEVVVLTGTPASTPMELASAPLDDASTAARVDERWLGCSRAQMLEARFQEIIATSTIARGAANRGYAMATPQGSHALVGPIVAEDEENARLLAGAIFRAVGGPVRIDVPATQRTFRHWLLDLGLRELGTRPEMALGTGRLPWLVPQRFALATQAWG